MGPLERSDGEREVRLRRARSAGPRSRRGRARTSSVRGFIGGLGRSGSSGPDGSGGPGAPGAARRRRRAASGNKGPGGEAAMSDGDRMTTTPMTIEVDGRRQLGRAARAAGRRLFGERIVGPRLVRKRVERERLLGQRVERLGLSSGSRLVRERVERRPGSSGQLGLVGQRVERSRIGRRAGAGRGRGARRRLNFVIFGDTPGHKGWRAHESAPIATPKEAISMFKREEERARAGGCRAERVPAPVRRGRRRAGRAPVARAPRVRTSCSPASCCWPFRSSGSTRPRAATSRWP